LTQPGFSTYQMKEETKELDQSFNKFNKSANKNNLLIANTIIIIINNCESHKENKISNLIDSNPNKNMNLLLVHFIIKSTLNKNNVTLLI
jgi:hypothetical protein